ncbi:Topoisomerase family protein TRF4 [Aspergillus sp. HF37]|nr:Topoisomerase family protein TRF4 [Aspergillus sp. HF37]
MPPPHQFRGNRGDRRAHPKHEFTFRYPRLSTAERPLLRSERQPTPEHYLPADSQDGESGQKFVPVTNISDSEEADMDLSSDEGHDAARPRKKRAVEADNAPASPAPAPKWSNPDPYTVLPPPDESQSKKVDVVKLIRKARVANASQPVKADPVATNEDFISFGPIGGGEGSNAPGDAPKGPRGHLPGKDSAVESRKRTYDDELKGFSKKTGKPMSRFNTDGSIIDEWRLRPYETGTPWLSLMEPTLHFGTSRLQNEILAFYHWARPQPYEHIVREDLVSRLQSAFQNRYYGVQLRPFGSFASGIYLPTADLDLVLLSTNFMRTGRKTFGERKGQIYAFAAFLRSLDIAVPNSIETIAHARVPILKFVDKLSGLRVDLSFDNDSGLIANNTFQRWKSEFPAMPVVVSVVKQFLLLRGLNEVPTGGLGGFSITCLVMSLLQHLPHGCMERNMAGVLIDFFDFYGNVFDVENVGIRMSPPGYFNKRVYKSYKDNNNVRLSIEDPNNPDNDISGGTREIELILRSFSDAHQLLRERMSALDRPRSTADSSILGPIIAANYDEYTQQRWQLRRVFDTDPRFAPYRQPPPPPPSDPVQPPPPPSEPLPAAPAPLEPGGKQTKSQKRQHASQERATRLRRLRPDLSYIPESVSNDQALKLGGYRTQSAMDRDLGIREKAIMRTAG